MWSLFKKKDEEKGGLSDFAISGDSLDPLKFSNGKTQADVVKEILDAINSGEKIIFVRGVCGTGKSSIALNLARHFNKTAIVVPIKSLQEQYEQDYTNKMFILKKDDKKLKISMIKGRNNFRCPFTGERCDDEFLPCTIELREKNMNQIKHFIELNKAVDKFDFTSIDDVRRMSVAPACPYWSPLLPAEINTKGLEGAKKKRYNSVSGKEYALFQRKRGCGYYDQYESYMDSDVLIFNSLKYLIESYMGRKPKTDLDIIDECDEFLDNFANEKSINLQRLSIALNNLNPTDPEQRNLVKELQGKVNDLIFDFSLEGVEKLEKTPISEFVDLILKSPYIAEDEDENYFNAVFETVKEFEQFLDETYVSFKKDVKDGRESVFINLVTINLAKKFEKIVEQNNVLVLMSGTLHTEQVLKDIFGLKKFKIVEAETITPGTITKFRTGLERNCKYENFKNGTVTRSYYLKALDACVGNAKLPALVHVNSFEDLPTELEKAEFKLDSLISREKLKYLQEKSQEEIDKFKTGKISVLFTTKCSRGVDFPGEKCNSIILTKFPYPNIQSLFWQILRKEQPEKFTEFYLDKSKRELLQKIYRGLRFKDDHILLLSPDSRVLEANLK